MAVYDALYRRAENDVLHEVENAVASAEPGMAAIRDAMLAVDRWATVNPEMAQLLIGRPIPGYIPAPDALDPSIRILGIFRQRSEEHTSELQSLMRISSAVFCLKKKKINDILTA